MNNYTITAENILEVCFLYNLSRLFLTYVKFSICIQYSEICSYATKLTFLFLITCKINIKPPCTQNNNELTSLCNAHTCSEFRSVNIHANTMDSLLTARKPNNHVRPSSGSKITAAFIIFLV